jgi:hypothetical protein
LSDAQPRFRLEWRTSRRSAADSLENTAQPILQS